MSLPRYLKPPVKPASPPRLALPLDYPASRHGIGAGSWPHPACDSRSRPSPFGARCQQSSIEALIAARVAIGILWGIDAEFNGGRAAPTFPSAP